MRPVHETCEPRTDILAGTFNPEIFTASLPQVLDHYRGRTATIDNIYTDPVQFFTQATYPTDGLKRVLGEVFGRLSGDNSMPAIHRLETAFGGGKTHTLIACAHLAFRGKELASVAGGVLNPDKLLDPGVVSVVGVAGDEIRVAKPKGKELVPYTLWGEIAYQVGGEELYKQVDAESAAFTEGKAYFEKVFGGRKVLVMLDELANYATRLEGVRANGSEQLAAFLMGLHGYARTTSGIAVVLTLAGSKDAFARQTKTIARLLSEVKGETVSEEEALRLATKALGEQQSVVARDATPVTPVEPGEISRVLTKRLFIKIEDGAAREAAAAYAEMYQKSRPLLPETAGTTGYRDRILSHYPFHPSLADYLNQKLSTVETFQGTRGVLRLLARTVRSLWGKATQTVPTIHASHLNLRDPDVVGEVLGRTGNSDLKDVLTADVGTADSAGLEGGASNAEAADRENKHPSGFPLYVYTWRVVFLHSLVGRDQGLNDNKFGISEPEALLAVAFPDLTPSQVQIALKKIKDSAYYLRRSDDGAKYYASLDPSPNVALMKIYRSLQGSEKVAELLVATARKVIRSDVREFAVATDIAIPDQIPDNKNQPVLALVSPKAGKINVEEMVTTKGPNKPREQQNTVLLLVPNTVVVTKPSAGGFMAEDEATQAYDRLIDLARWVFAARALRDKPQDHGINPAKLAAEDFDARVKERENALVTAVNQAYSSLWFHSAGGSGYVRKEVKTGGGESGTSMVEVVRKALREDSELVTADDTKQSELSNLAKLFFTPSADTIAVAKVRDNFWCLRHWPMLESAATLDRIVREGVHRGQWCLFRMTSPDSTKPDEFFDRGAGDLPLNLDLTKADYTLITTAGAKKRNWGKQAVDVDKVKSWIKDTVSQSGKATVAEVAAKVTEQHGEVPKAAFTEAVVSLLQEDKFCTVPAGKSAQLISGSKAALHSPADADVLITKAKAAEDGLLVEEKKAFRLSGKEAAVKLLAVLKRADTLFNRGVKAKIDTLQLHELELPKGGTIRIDLVNVPPESLKQLGELFGVLTGVVKAGANTDADFEVSDPPVDCPLLKELGK